MPQSTSPAIVGVPPTPSLHVCHDIPVSPSVGLCSPNAKPPLRGDSVVVVVVLVLVEVVLVLVLVDVEVVVVVEVDDDVDVVVVVEVLVVVVLVLVSVVVVLVLVVQYSRITSSTTYPLT